MLARLASVAFTFAVASVFGQVPAISAGGRHTCAVDTTGAAYCWGDNGSGQVGDGVASAAIRVDVTGLSEVTHVDGGFQHTCALTVTGAVKCWGNNTSGQLGDGTTTTRATAANVAGLTSGVVDIAAGFDFTCALRGGGVKCWGANAGNLGNGSSDPSSVPVDVTPLGATIIAIAAGEGHACALTSAGGVKCWGNNSAGQLGDGTNITRNRPVDVAGITSGASSIFAGARHTCAIMASGLVKCWGSNAKMQLGDGTTTDRNSPVNVAGLPAGILRLALSSYASCAVTSGGGVMCWGGNASAELGSGPSSAPKPTPASVTGLSNTSQIDAGISHFCALSFDGTMSCWGDNTVGELGAGDTHDVVQPKPVLGLGNIAGIGLGGLHTCAIVGGGAGVKCWGDNLNGQLGNANTRRYNIAVPVFGLSSGVAAIAAGFESTCALTTGGGVKCWGSNEQGQLGDGTFNDRAFPNDVTGLGSGVRAIALGPRYGCALTNALAVKCWGVDNSFHTLPTDIVGVSSGINAIAAGAQHGCAVTLSGGAKCWGRNERGQLGDGSQTSSDAAVDVAGLNAGVAAVAAGTLHSCALTTAGGVKCWGSNDAGQLGTGTNVPSTTAVDVAGMQRGVQAIAAFQDSTCALTTSGGFWCWGQVSRSAIASVVPGLADGAVAISTGNTHACAIVRGGGVVCFGENRLGQLGDGTGVLSRAIPATVVASDAARFLDLTPGDPLATEKLSSFVAVTSGLASAVNADIRFRQADVGRSGSVYVFALAPPSVVHAAVAAKDTPVQCVLAQLNSAGQLQAVSASSLQASVSGVLSAQGQSVAVLNGVNAANVAGATFYVGYGSSSSQMLESGTSVSVLSVPGAVQCTPQPPQTGWWWNPGEGGRGYSIEISGNRIFFAAFLYDVSGRSTWLAASGPTALDGSLFLGTLTGFSGGQTLGGSYPGFPSSHPEGPVTLAFSDARHGTMIGPGGTVPIERFNITPNGLNLPPLAGQPESGWWWNPNESGRGFFMEWQGGYAFIAGYMYNPAGNPLWYHTQNAAALTDLQSYAGTWVEYGNGQTLGGPFKPPTVVNPNVAPVTLQFNGVDAAAMSGGITTPLTRFRF